MYYFIIGNNKDTNKCASDLHMDFVEKLVLPGKESISYSIGHIMKHIIILVKNICTHGLQPSLLSYELLTGVRPLVVQMFKYCRLFVMLYPLCHTRLILPDEPQDKKANTHTHTHQT